MGPFLAPTADSAGVFHDPTVKGRSDLHAMPLREEQRQSQKLLR